MPFDLDCPFVRDVYSLVGKGELDKCETLLRELIEHLPPSDFHCVLEVDFSGFISDYTQWLLDSCDEEPVLDGSIAIVSSMGSFEINDENWAAWASVHERYQETEDPYLWLCESEGFLFSTPFSFEGFDQIRAAFEKVMETEAEVVDDASSLTQVYTAACYLVFVMFCRLNRQAHIEAQKRGHGFAKTHLFADYGDCLFHSAPLSEQRIS